MPEQISINRITNANIYIDGDSFLGRAEEVSIGPVKFKMAEHKALGMIGTAEFFSGIEKIEAKIKWSSFYKEVFEKIANPFAVLPLMVYGSVQNFVAAGKTEAEMQVKITLNGVFKDIPLGSFKQNDNAEFESNMSVYYLKLEAGGNSLIEVDVLTNTYKAGGDDVLAEYKENIGQ